ncbi:DNA phosphorothioation-dependent restriction protein DptH [Tepidibacter aestuarii]|uniref:DNA phosphorothioation-dependent restriction protein DptH n=1 Tax=Tepidibacter aestuarii TaxID=2925782 RepID=UPI0020BF6F54|nr:DNA phosphorothioation-dependent restriction protein DptH [Tepidibacter aestuarii]CAH2213351.1 DNA phosphorothioation-dependent restriction protein DptH [Tepidibacter aestuarii]
MSKEFYNYLAKKVIQYFNLVGVKNGERFDIQFEREDEVRALYDEIKIVGETNIFSYKAAEDVEEYKTISFKVSDIDIIVAATIDGIQPDYLTKLRNEVSSNEDDKFRNTAIIFIHNTTLDSIIGGATSFRKEGMPFHIVSITNDIKKDLEKSELTSGQKNIVNFELEKNNSSNDEVTSLLQFEELLKVINKGFIDKAEYKNFGLFFDNQLENFSGNEVETRIKQNAEIFSKVDSIHKFQGDAPTALEKFLDEKGVDLLSDPKTWEDLDFSTIKASIENKKKTKKVQFEGYDLFNIEQENFWDKPNRETVAGNRKRRIIIFNPNNETKLQFSIKFDERISQKEISVDKNQEATVKASGKKIIVEIEHEIGKVSFNTIKLKASENYEFKIVIIDLINNIFKDTEIQTAFNIGKVDKENVITLNTKSDVLTLNTYEVSIENYEIKENREDIYIESLESKIVILNDVDIDENTDFIRVNVNIQGVCIPLAIKDEGHVTVPIGGYNVWIQKREERKDFKYIDSKLVQGSRTYYPKEDLKVNLKREEQFINEGSLFFVEKNSELYGENLEVPGSLKEAYASLINYYKVNRLLPSLAYYNEELSQLAFEYVNEYLNTIDKLEEGGDVKSIHRDLVKVGTIKVENGENQILLTPLHPINVMYQIEIQKQIGSERLHERLAKKLESLYLLPYIAEYKTLYKPIEQNHSKEWKYYVKNDTLKYKSSRKFVAKLVKEKIEEFVQHFSYLFEFSSKSPIKINLINTGDSKEVLQGIIAYYISELKKNIKINDLKEICINIYSEEDTNVFEELSFFQTVDEVENNLKLNLEPLGIGKNYLKEDILSICREKIKFYRKDINSDRYEYCHITFYEMDQNLDEKDSKMNAMITGVSLNGIISGVPSKFINDTYRTGFGNRYMDNSEKNLLLRVATGLNSLYRTVQNEVSYTKLECRTTIISEQDNEKLDKIYNSSNWVTFIEPKVDLKFFKDNAVDKGLLIIHYSDQYTSSSGYDSITVTRKSEQYELIIKEFLEDKEVNITQDSVVDVINCFNAVNGDWLLRLISSNGQFPKEKISIISAIKLSMAYFYHKDIIWIPISLEEVLRVSKGAGLSGSDGLFSVKNLKGEGQYSDDLLLIGIEVCNENLKVHYYPIEVKIGDNSSTVIKKAKKQAYKTRNYLEKHLIEVDDEDETRRFGKKMYRNFMMQLAIVSAEKMKLYNIWEEQNWNLIIDSDTRKKLLNDDYKIVNDLDELIGRGAVMSFKKGITFNDEAKEIEVTKEELGAEYDEEEFAKGNKFLEIIFGESQGYNNIIRPMESIKQDFVNGQSDFEKEKLLAYKYYRPTSKEDIRNEDVEVEEEEITDFSNAITGGIKEEVAAVIENQFEISRPEEESIRVLLGSSKGKDIYWEFGNKGLGNRHLLISGKSGQGKTYFIQCLLLELSRKGVPSIIFDYTDGFKSSKLEPEFKEIMGDNLKQFIVAKDKFPINPFKKNQKELDEDLYIDEDSIDIAERIKSVLGSVYKQLGIQQLNAIYQATISGLYKHGDKMNFISLRDELEEDNSGSSKSAIGQLNPLIDKNPFDNTKEFNWKDILDSDGKVFIIQLTGFTRDVQLIITELILWDLWYFTVQNGSKDKPFSVILDEAQNLDFGDNSPYTRILTEGRKFGWSGWFATQFIKGQMSTSEINRLQNAAHKIYFAPPDEEISSIANTLSTNADEKKDLERGLMRLQKGECISYGPCKTLNSTLRNSIEKVKISSLKDRTL